MSKRFVILVLAITGCGVEVESGAGGGESVAKEVRAVTFFNNGHDYMFVQTPMFWSEARSYCVSIGHMVTIGDNLENEFVRDQAYQHGAGLAWWIGRNDQAVEGTWVWDSKETLRFDNWASGEPNNYNNEDCAEMDSGTGLWNDVTCIARLMFVCERDSSALGNTRSFSYNATNTGSDTQNYVVSHVLLNNGEGVSLGTCGVPGATNNGTDTYLRLYDPTNTTQLAYNDDACDDVGSNISAVIGNTGMYTIRAGCYGSGSCSGTVAIRQELQAPPPSH